MDQVEAGVRTEALPCRCCALETIHQVRRHAYGCVGICEECGTPQVCPCNLEEVQAAHRSQACPWHRP